LNHFSFFFVLQYNFIELKTFLTNFLMQKIHHRKKCEVFTIRPLLSRELIAIHCSNCPARDKRMLWRIAVRVFKWIVDESLPRISRGNEWFTWESLSAFVAGRRA